MERIAITGAAGYIGSRVCHELKDTYEIVPLDDFSRGKIREIDGIKVIPANICDLNQLEPLRDADVVLHLAAISGVDECVNAPELAHHVNVIGTQNVGSLCRQKSIPLIFPSTVGVFGDPVYFPLDERHPRKPVNLYGKTKKSACEALRTVSEGVFPVYEFIKSNVFGVHTLNDEIITRPNVISIFINNAKRNESLKVYNPGTQARNFLHVEDAARSYVLGVGKIREEERVYKEFCIAGRESVTVRQLAEMICCKAEERGYSPDIMYVENPRNETLVSQFEVDTTKARSELGFTPQLIIEHEIERAFKE